MHEPNDTLMSVFALIKLYSRIDSRARDCIAFCKIMKISRPKRCALLHSAPRRMQIL